MDTHSRPCWVKSVPIPLFLWTAPFFYFCTKPCTIKVRFDKVYHGVLPKKTNLAVVYKFVLIVNKDLPEVESDSDDETLHESSATVCHSAVDEQQVHSSDDKGIDCICISSPLWISRTGRDRIVDLMFSFLVGTAMYTQRNVVSFLASCRNISLSVKTIMYSDTLISDSSFNVWCHLHFHWQHCTKHNQCQSPVFKLLREAILTFTPCTNFMKFSQFMWSFMPAQLLKVGLAQGVMGLKSGCLFSFQIFSTPWRNCVGSKNVWYIQEFAWPPLSPCQI